MPEATINTIDFRNAMARFATGVTVVTTRDPDGRAHGFTASAFSSLSLEPPLVLVCLEKRARSHPIFMAATHMAISILSIDQIEIALHFARPNLDKFAGLAAIHGKSTSIPLIPASVAHLECRITDRFDGGDHTIIIGKVLSIDVTERDPLIYYNRQFGRFIPI